MVMKPDELVRALESAPRKALAGTTACMLSEEIIQELIVTLRQVGTAQHGRAGKRTFGKEPE